LCDIAKNVLREAQQRADFEYQEVDIDRDPELRQRYTDEVPVIAINGVATFRYSVDLKELLRRLAACV
jgi:glutaredoxin